MDILKRYTNVVAKIVFATRMSRNTFEERRFATYAFLCRKDIRRKLEPGDFVVIETRNGLQIGVFVEFSHKEEDVNLASKEIICKISDYNVDHDF